MLFIPGSMARFHKSWRGVLMISTRGALFLSDLAHTASHHVIWLPSAEREANISEFYTGE